MSFLLDTCVISELSKDSGLASPAVLRWLSSTDEDQLHLSAITLAELRRGISRLPASHKKTRLESFLSRIRRRFSGRILPVDEKVAIAWGELFALERPLNFPDSLIAATAWTHNLKVVTRNQRDIIKVETINPWEQ